MKVEGQKKWQIHSDTGETEKGIFYTFCFPKFSNLDKIDNFEDGKQNVLSSVLVFTDCGFTRIKQKVQSKQS